MQVLVAPLIGLTEMIAALHRTYGRYLSMNAHKPPAGGYKSEASGARRVLMIAGASFTDVLVNQYARHVSAGSPHEFSALGLGNSAGRPAEPTTYRFAESRPFPRPEWPPQGLKDVLGAVSALALSSPPPGGVGHLRDSSLPQKHTLYQRLLWGEYRRTLPRFFRSFDVFHWHCIDPSRLAALHLIPPGGKVILTPWGSDLYRTAGITEYTRQLHACRRADVITMPSPEMREVLLAKFGRELSSRIRLVRYGTEKLDVIDRVKREGKTSLSKVNLPPNRLVVCVGNAGSRFNQHVQILRSLHNLSPSLAARITLVLPMTYTRPDPRYLATVRDAIPPNLTDAVILTGPLSSEEVAQFRCSIDILIHLPVSNAFSAAMCEALYAGAVLITGSWLPYSPLRTSGVHYREVSEVSDTPDALRLAVENYEQEKLRTRTAPAVIRSLVSWQAVAPQWRSLYDQHLSETAAEPGRTNLAK